MGLCNISRYSRVLNAGSNTPTLIIAIITVNTIADVLVEDLSLIHGRFS